MDSKGINPAYFLPQQVAWQDKEIKKKREPRVKAIPESQLDELKASDKKEKEKLQKETPQQQNLEKLAEETNDALQRLKSEIKFCLSKETDDIVVQIVNRETDEVIREIPPEELVELKNKLREINGFLCDKKV